MTSITTRAGKGSALTHAEVDANFTNLNTDKLDIAGIAAGTAASPSITFTGDINTGIYSPGADQLAISTGGIGRLFVDANGRVGVGTGSPTSLGTNVTTVEIQGAATTRSGGVRLSSSDSSQKGAFYIYDGVAVLGTETSHPLGLYVGNTERARIDGSGRLLVGASSDSGGALLQVNGDRVRIATAKTPASASATGTAGEVCWDASYIYVCTATNTWKRAALSSW